jgi:hypothetical protein
MICYIICLVWVFLPVEIARHFAPQVVVSEREILRPCRPRLGIRVTNPEVFITVIKNILLVCGWHEVMHRKHMLNIDCRWRFCSQSGSEFCKDSNSKLLLYGLQLTNGPIKQIWMTPYKVVPESRRWRWISTVIHGLADRLTELQVSYLQMP